MHESESIRKSIDIICNEVGYFCPQLDDNPISGTSVRSTASRLMVQKKSLVSKRVQLIIHQYAY